jgi:hypothetical protein
MLKAFPLFISCDESGKDFYVSESIPARVAFPAEPGSGGSPTVMTIFSVSGKATFRKRLLRNLVRDSIR